MRALFVRAALVLGALSILVPSTASASFGLLPGEEGFSAAAYAEGSLKAEQAGSHPSALEIHVGFNQAEGFSDGDPRNLELALPPGLIENASVVSECSQNAFGTPRSSPFEESLSGESCPDGSQIGVVTVDSSYGGGERRSFGVFNLEAPSGAPSEFGFNAYGAPVVFVPSVRQADGEYGLTLKTRNLPQLVSIKGLTLRIWGTPWLISYDAQRGNCLNEAEPEFGWAKCTLGPPRISHPQAYLTMPTDCEAPLSFTVSATSWQQSGTAHRTVELPPLRHCDLLIFSPKPVGRLNNPRASSSSGYNFEIGVETQGVTDPELLAPTPVRKSVVALPRGVTINPSVGAGLGICSPGGYAAETVSSPAGAGCPNDSKIGDFTVDTPIFAQPVEGSLFLAAPFDNPFGSLVGIYLVAKAPDRGILVKVAGKLDLDPSSGDVLATFENLPQLPYSRLDVHFREGQRSPLASPPACGALETSIDLTPWRDPTFVRHVDSPTNVTAGPGGGPCPQGTPPFTPTALAGSINSNAGSYTPFYLHLARTDSEQEITSYSAQLPPGLLGKIAGVPYCPEAAIAAAARRSGVAERDDPSCPRASLIGHTSSGYGLGPILTYAPGNLYLAGPYHGSPISVVAIDSALVGPFDLGVVIVRSAIDVDPSTAQVSVDSSGSDPIPHILDGIPIHLRDVRVYIDRPTFALNPTSCNRFSVASTLSGSGTRFSDPGDDSVADAIYNYQAFNCGALGFKPKVALRLKGSTKRGHYPRLRVTVSPRAGDTNIASAQVALPPTIFLAQNHLNTLCTRGQFARGACPAGSVYGHATVYTPLLEAPMRGPVYLRSSDNPLPDLVFALNGRGIEIDLVGRIDSANGGIRGSFGVIPDAPVSKFELSMFGGKRGILVNAANLCKSPQRAKARFVGQSSLGALSRPIVKADCRGKHGQKRPGRGRR